MMKIFRYVEKEQDLYPRDPFTQNIRIMEYWLPLEYADIKPGCYLISNLGRIYSLKANKIKSTYNDYGYRDVSLQVISDVDKNKSFRVHTLVAHTFFENPENKQFVNHKNTYRDDNAIYNLEYVTHSENMQHANQFYKQYPYMQAVPQEQSMSGPDNGWVKAKWTDEQVHIICKSIENGCDYATAITNAGIEYTVNARKTVNKIVKGTRYQGIACQYTFPEGRAKRSMNISDYNANKE